MISDIINFIFERWRRWKYKEDYSKDAVIKVDKKNNILQYKLQDKETYAKYAYTDIVATSIDIWSNGEEISKKDKSLVFIDLLYFIQEYAGKKANVLIEKNHPEKDYWLTQTSKHSYLIDSIRLFDEEEEFQEYLDELSKAFHEGKKLEINGKIIDNREDLEALLRDK